MIASPWVGADPRPERGPWDIPEWASDMALSFDRIHQAVSIYGSTSVGTGFFVVVSSESLPDVKYVYVVTAHHVVQGQTDVVIQASDPFAQPKGARYPPLRVDGWRQPLDGVDLAIAPAPMGQRQTWAYVELGVDLIPADRLKSQMNGRRLMPLGAPVYYIGLFAPLNRVMVRSGTIAALDQEGVPRGPELPDGSHAYDYPFHLVDCRSYGGFSGSPCYIAVPFSVLKEIDSSPLPRQPGEKLPPLGTIQYLALCCGMFTDHITDDMPPEGAVSRYGVGLMLRGEEIKEALMTDESRNERKAWDAERKARGTGGPIITPASARAEEDEFGRFGDLAGKLLKVPKKELDKKREEERK